MSVLGPRVIRRREKKYGNDWIRPFDAPNQSRTRDPPLLHHTLLGRLEPSFYLHGSVTCGYPQLSIKNIKFSMRLLLLCLRPPPTAPATAPTTRICACRSYCCSACARHPPLLLLLLPRASVPAGPVAALRVPPPAAPAAGSRVCAPLCLPLLGVRARCSCRCSTHPPSCSSCHCSCYAARPAR